MMWCDYDDSSSILVMMPGIEWKQECLAGSGGQRNMKCMTWRENKDKVINVMCVLKCEAKKMTAAGEAAASLQDIRVRFFINLPFLHLMLKIANAS